MVYYPIPLHRQPVYKHLGYSQEALPITDRAAAEVLALPMFPELTTEQQNQVVSTLKDALKNPPESLHKSLRKPQDGNPG